MDIQKSVDVRIVRIMRQALLEALQFFPPAMRTTKRSLGMAERIFWAASKGEDRISVLRAAALFKAPDLSGAKEDRTILTVRRVSH